MPRKAKEVEIFDVENIYALDTREEIEEFLESYTIGGFDNYSESNYDDYDMDNYAYDDYSY